MFEKLKNLFVEELQIDEADITMDAELIKDLGINSIGLLYMAMAVEEEFGVKFKNEDFAGIQTVGDVIVCIEGKL